MQYFLHYVEMPANNGIFIKFGEYGLHNRLELYKTYNPLITNVNFYQVHHRCNKNYATILTDILKNQYEVVGQDWFFIRCEGLPQIANWFLDRANKFNNESDMQNLVNLVSDIPLFLAMPESSREEVFRIF